MTMTSPRPMEKPASYDTGRTSFGTRLITCVGALFAGAGLCAAAPDWPAVSLTVTNGAVVATVEQAAYNVAVMQHSSDLVSWRAVREFEANVADQRPAMAAEPGFYRAFQYAIGPRSVKQTRPLLPSPPIDE